MLALHACSPCMHPICLQHQQHLRRKCRQAADGWARACVQELLQCNYNPMTSFMHGWQVTCGYAPPTAAANGHRSLTEWLTPIVQCDSQVTFQDAPGSARRPL